jgi:hypothetical protein
MTTSNQSAASAANAQPVLRNILIATPFTLAVPVGYGLWFHLQGIPLAWPALGVGTAGWVVALILRNPIALIARVTLKSWERVQPWVVAASGPCEEGVRVAAVLLFGRGFTSALSIGLGWAAIEVVYSIVNGLAVVSLTRRTDAKARQALQMLNDQGLGGIFGPMAPFWGIVERIFVSGLHIGFTLLLAWQPWLVLVTIPLHSGLNFTYLRLARRSVALAELVMALVGLAALLTGFAVFGRL